MKRYTALILTGYLLLSILMTWPVALHVSDAIPGDGFDGWQNVWNLWWIKKALLELGVSPFFTDYIYPPTGASLLFHTLNIFNSLWTLPIHLIFGQIAAYNAVVFFSFVMAGYAGYLLSLYTLSCVLRAKKDGGLSARIDAPLSAQRLRLAAFIGGLIFTMSPFHFAHLLGHMQVFSMVWPPFYILWLIRTLKVWQNKPPLTAERWRATARDIALTALFLALATLVDWYHTLYLLLFTGLVMLWLLLTCDRRQFGLRLGITILIGLCFALVASPLIIPMMQRASERPDLDTGLYQNITLSADLLAYVLPSELHPLWGEWATSIANNFTSTTSERLIFVGFTPLLLGLYAAARYRRNRIVLFWTLIAAAFFILSLGPYLHVNGQIIAVDTWQLPLPYLLLYHIVPFIRLTRSLSRYNMLVMLALGVLAAIGAQRLSTPRWFNKKAGSAWLIPALIPLICFEFLAAPYPISMVDTPQFYKDIARDNEDYVIAELPMNWDRPTPMFYQTIHQKRLLTAYTSRNNPLELAWRMPVLQHWRYLGPDIIAQPLPKVASTILYDFNLRYIVLDFWQMPPGPEQEATLKWVQAALPGIPPAYDDGRLRVYQSPSLEQAQPYLSMGQGWGERHERNGLLLRSLAQSPAEVFVHHPQSKALTFEITLASDRPQAVMLIADEAELDTFQPGQEPTLYQVALPSSAHPYLKLELHASTPIDITVSRLNLLKSVQ